MNEAKYSIYHKGLITWLVVYRKDEEVKKENLYETYSTFESAKKILNLFSNGTR